jgi:Bacterial cadherin-like domain
MGSEVTANDTDVDGDALNVTQASCNAGSVTINPDQSLQVSSVNDAPTTVADSATTREHVPVTVA